MKSSSTSPHLQNYNSILLLPQQNDNKNMHRRLILKRNLFIKFLKRHLPGHQKCNSMYKLFLFWSELEAISQNIQFVVYILHHCKNATDHLYEVLQYPSPKYLDILHSVKKKDYSLKIFYKSLTLKLMWWILFKIQIYLKTEEFNKFISNFIQRIGFIKFQSQNG